MKRQFPVLMSTIIALASLFGSISNVAAVDTWEGGPHPVSASFSCTGLVDFEVDWSAGGPGTTIRVQIMTSDQEVLETQYAHLYDAHALNPDRTSFSIQMNPASWSSQASWQGLFAQVSGSPTDLVKTEPQRCLKPGETDPSSGLVFIESADRRCQANDTVDFSTLSFVVRNKDVKDARFSWAITTADGTVIQGGANSEPVGAQSARTIQSDLIGPQYHTQSLIVKVSPVDFDPTSITVSPCTIVDPGPQPTETASPTNTAVPSPTPTNTFVPTETTPPTAIPTATPIPNSFKLTAAARACSDQRFSASWTGSNLKTVEFALSNTSDEWTSGWLSVDAASGTFTAPVDHHGYDKVMARASFADGSTAQQDADVGTCTEAPAPQPTQPSKPAPSQPGGVTNLPKTGAGGHADLTMYAFASVAVLMLAAGVIRGISRRAG